MQGWGRRLATVAKKHMPVWNNHLMSEFREEKINEIPYELGKQLTHITKIIDQTKDPSKPSLIYTGNCRELLPEERIARIRDQGSYRRNIQIKPTYCRQLAYEFSFNGNTYLLHQAVPYLHNGAIVINGVNYYPIFAIVERGGIYNGENDTVIVQVSLGKLIFNRGELVTLKTEEGPRLIGNNIVAKIHQKKSRGKKQHPPLIIYHLVHEGWNKTLARYGMTGKVDIVPSPIEGNLNIKVRGSLTTLADDVYISIKGTDIPPDNVIRFVVNLFKIFKKHPWTKITDLKDYRYYIHALGSWVYESIKNQPSKRYNNTCTFIEMNRNLIDEANREQHATVGVIYDDFDGLLHYMFNNIDDMVNLYRSEQNNLLTRKVASSHQMLSSLSRTINTKLCQEVLNSKDGLTDESVKALLRGVGYTDWIKSPNNDMFRSLSDLINDNINLAIGSTRIRTTANPELGDSRRENRLSGNERKAHPSFLVVESINTASKTHPVIAGSINPFVLTDKNGNFIVPEWYDEIKHIFD